MRNVGLRYELSSSWLEKHDNINRLGSSSSCIMGEYNWDGDSGTLTLMENVSVKERVRVPICWELFNTTNTPSIGDPTVNFDSPDFGGGALESQHTASDAILTTTVVVRTRAKLQVMRRTLALLLLSAASPLLADTWLILPFLNLSSDANLQWIGESLSESAHEALAAEGLIVLGREQREEAYRRLSIRPNTQVTTATVMRIGELLDADQIVYGTFAFTPPADPSLAKTKGTLRVVAHILSLRRARRGPEYAEIGSLEDLARLQNHLAWQTLQFAKPRSAPSEEEFRQRNPVVRVDAIENYVRGLLAATPDQKQRLFSQAVRLDPRFSQASFQLAKLNFGKKAWRTAADLFASVMPGGVHSREAQYYLGICRYRLGEFETAAAAFRTVAESVPLNEVWNNLGAAQSRHNDPEALASFQKALDGDPADPDYQFNVGYALLRQGDTEKAAERFRAVLERRPDDAEAITMLGRSLRKTPARTPAAPSEGVERLKETFEESAWLQLKSLVEPKPPAEKTSRP